LTQKSRRHNGRQHRIADRVRTECIRRGWSLKELAHRSGVSRTTLYHLQRGHTDRPHNETLLKVASALRVPIEVLLDTDDRDARLASGASRVWSSNPPGGDHHRTIDTATNPAVAEVLRNRPELFEHWSQEEFDALRSLSGAGGVLTPRGVELAAESINRRRETIVKLKIVLETHLRKDAMDMVDMFYRMVPPQMRPPEPLQGDGGSAGA
jgi:transcriptional regulator with XRE-family HTH domain